MKREPGFLEKYRIEENDRDKGIENLSKFLDKIFSDEELRDPATFLNYFQTKSIEELTNFISRINGLINNISIADRKNVSEIQSGIVIGGYKDLIEIKPPSPEYCQSLLHEIYEKIHQLDVGDITDLRLFSRTLYNLVIYLHMFKDGNGRTARLMFTLSNPEISKNKVALHYMIKSSVKNRHSAIDEYHWMINSGTYQSLLIKRGIEVGFDGLNHLTNQLIRKDVWGFDNDYLGFLTAFDVMTEQEREKYKLTKPDASGFYFDYDQLPVDIQEKIKLNKESVREEFTRAVLEGVMDKQDWPEFMDEKLNSAIISEVDNSDN